MFSSKYTYKYTPKNTKIQKYNPKVVKFNPKVGDTVLVSNLINKPIIEWVERVYVGETEDGYMYIQEPSIGFRYTKRRNQYIPRIALSRYIHPAKNKRKISTNEYINLNEVDPPRHCIRI